MASAAQARPAQDRAAQDRPAQSRSSARATASRGAAPRPGGGPRLISPAIREMFARSKDAILAIILALVGLGLLVALATYNPLDPSLNTATTRAPSNLAGHGGAMAADLLLQFFGLAAALPGLALLAWAWRVGNHAPLRAWFRVPALLLATPSLAGLLGGLPLGPQTWLGGSWLGGAAGLMIADGVLSFGQSIFGTIGGILAGLVSAALAVTLTLAALGLTLSEWRAAGRRAGGAARVSLEGGRRAATFAAPAAGIASRVGGLFMRLLNGPQREEAAPRNLRRDRAYDDAPPLPTKAGLPPLDELVDRDDDDSADSYVPALLARSPIDTGRAARAPAKTKNTARRQESLPLGKTQPGWRFPPLSLLKPAPTRASSGPSQEAMESNARLLETVLDDYGVQGVIRDQRPGPVVTLYELEPAPGIRSARVIGLADDVARSLSVTAVRIATVPGRNVIGIEVPNARRETVFLSEMFTSREWEHSQGKLMIALGKDIGGEPVYADLARMPHLLVAGTTGSGKSVGINAMILSLLYRLPPEDCRLILIDPKMLELSVYDGIPHLLAPVVTEPAKAVTALKWTTREMERRYRNMSQLGVRNIGGYNERVADAQARGEVVTRRVQTGFDAETGKPIFEDQPLALEKMPFIVLIIDEMADLMMVAGKEIEITVQRLAQMARAAGIHVVMATQRPSVDVITGTIKANFPTRISFQVISKFDSRTILGEQGAEQLLGQGDLLWMAGGGRITRVHGPFVTDNEVEEVVAYLRTQGEPSYVEEVTELPEGGEEAGLTMSGIAGASEGEKGLFDQAVALVSREGKASTSFIQRHLGIGYNRAAKLIEQMEKEGIVGPANHVGKREVLTRRTRDEDEY